MTTFLKSEHDNFVIDCYIADLILLNFVCIHIYIYLYMKCFNHAGLYCIPCFYVDSAFILLP